MMLLHWRSGAGQPSPVLLLHLHLWEIPTRGAYHQRADCYCCHAQYRYYSLQLQHCLQVLSRKLAEQPFQRLLPGWQLGQQQRLLLSPLLSWRLSVGWTACCRCCLSLSASLQPLEVADVWGVVLAFPWERTGRLLLLLLLIWMPQRWLGGRQGQRG